MYRIGAGYCGDQNTDSVLVDCGGTLTFLVVQNAEYLIALVLPATRIECELLSATGSALVAVDKMLPTYQLAPAV